MTASMFLQLLGTVVLGVFIAEGLITFLGEIIYRLLRHRGTIYLNPEKRASARDSIRFF